MEEVQSSYNSILDEIDLVWQQMSSHLIPTTFGCLHHNYSGTKKTKTYAQVRYKNKKYYCHIVSAMVRVRRAPMEGEEASHLCGNSSCIEPSHFTFETGPINKSRLCCHLYLGKHSSYICPHEPKCIIVTK